MSNIATVGFDVTNRSWVLARGFDPADFPLYDGRPTGLTSMRWLGLVVAVATSLLTWDLLRPAGWELVLVLALPLVPLVVLASVAPGHWTSLFRPVGRPDLAWAVVAGIACLGVVHAGAALAGPGPSLVPGATVELATLSDPGLALAWLEAVLVLVGEEVLAILVFLSLLAATSRHGMTRRRATVVAWVGGTVVWTLLALPLHDFDVGRTLVVGGSVRGILLGLYLKTKNAWSPLVAHAVQDTGTAASMLVG